MKKIYLIGLTAIMLLVGASTVSAIDLDDFKLSDGFDKESSNLAINDDFSLSVAKYDKDLDYDLLFKDDGDYTVTVGEISKYVDKEVKHVGVLEVVEIDDEQVLIEIYSEDMSKLDECYDKLVEFNELNNLNPVEV